MRVGFIKQLLWERYGEMWVRLLEGMGAEVQFADPTEVKKQFEAHPEIPGISFRLAVAEALTLIDTDLLVVPDLNPNEEVARGSGQNPWIARFPEVLQRVAGLPPVVKVPARLAADLEPLVLETLLSLQRDLTRVRLVWERNQQTLKPKHYPEPRWSKLPGQSEVVGVIGQPWLLTQQLLRLLERPERHLVSQQQFNPAALREEARRLEKRLIASDAEILGAAHYFNRKGNVDKLLALIDNSSGADVWLEKQIRKIVSKPLEVVYLQDLVPEDRVVETLGVTY
jgi:hypothetical protein